ncbi:MAG: hypothetical protein JXA22_10805 [Candidatus Thermoplasmatota archaeon]|nr:hypothetical protein [Candidatus Thermoplasmatota archaeon]
MQGNVIDIGQARRSRRLYSPIRTWLVISIILTFVHIPVWMVEVATNNSCYTLIVGAFLFPLVPGLIFAFIYQDLNTIPARVELYADTLRFVYIRGSKITNVDIPWGEIIEIIPYDKLRTSRNREVRLHYLDRAGMDLILSLIESPEKLDISDVVSLMNLDRASRRFRVEPAGCLNLPNDSAAIKTNAIVYCIFLVPLNLLLLTVLMISLSMGEVIIAILGGTTLLLFLIISVLLMVIMFRTMKAKELYIDRTGARVITKDGPLWDLSWREIEKVTNNRGKSNSWVTFQPIKGKAVSVACSEYKLDDLKTAFKLAQDYCMYHRIPVINTLGW